MLKRLLPHPLLSVLLLVIVFPQVAMWLPTRLGY